MARIRVKFRNGIVGSIEENDYDQNSMQRIDEPTVKTAKELTPQDKELLKKLTPEKKEPGLVQSLAKPFIDTGKRIAEAGFQSLVTALPGGPGDTDAKPVGPFPTEQSVRLKKPTLFMSEEELADRGKIIKDAAKSTAGIASYAIPFGQGGNFATKALIPGAATGVLSGVSDEKQSNPLYDLLFGAATAGATRTATNAIGGAAKLLTKKTPEALMAGVFKEGAKQSRAAVAKGETLGSEALKRSVKGGDESIYIKSLDAVENAESELQSKLSASNKTVPVSAVKEAIKPLVEKYNRAGNLKAAKTILDRVAAIEEQNGNAIPVATANQIKRSLYAEVQSAYGTEAAASAEGTKLIAKSLKEGIEKIIPTAKELNNTMSVYGRMANVMKDKLAKQRGPSAVDALTGGAGVVGAAMTGNPIFLAPELVKMAQGSTSVKTNVANALNTVGKLGGQNTRSGKLDYLLGQLSSRLGARIASGGQAPEGLPAPVTLPNNYGGNDAQSQKYSPAQLPDVNIHAQNIPQTQATGQQIPGAPQDGALSPQGQWKYSAAAGDWVPVKETESSNFTSDQLYQALIENYQKTGKINAGLKSLYDMQLKREGKGGTKRSMTEAETARQQVSDLTGQALSLLEGDSNIKTGFIGGPLESLKGKFGAADQNSLDFNVMVSNLQATIAKARGGTSFTPNEQALLERYSPKVGDSRQELVTKLKQLQKLNFQKNPYTTTDSYDYSPEAIQAALQSTQGGF